MARVYAIKNPLFLADTFVFKKHPKYVSVYIKLSGGKIEEIGTDIVSRMHYNCATDEIIERSQEPSEIQKTLLEHISDEYFAHIVRIKKR